MQNRHWLAEFMQNWHPLAKTLQKFCVDSANGQNKKPVKTDFLLIFIGNYFANGQHRKDARFMSELSSDSPPYQSQFAIPIGFAP